MKSKGVTLTEVLVAIAVMSIMSGVMALSSATVGQQTAKREAERVAAFIQGHISRENIAKRGLWFQVNENSIQVWHGLSSNAQEVPKLDAYHGCKYTPSQVKMCYNVKAFSKGLGWKAISGDSTVGTDNGTKGQHYISVEGADKKSLYVIIGRNL